MLPDDWIAHRRPDGETLGWMVPDGDGFHVRDRLGRQVTDHPIDWLAAEELLDDRGIGYLADRWLLRLPDGTERPVRIVEASADRVVVVSDDFGSASAVGAVLDEYRLPFPPPNDLRPR